MPLTYTVLRSQQRHYIGMSHTTNYTLCDNVTLVSEAVEALGRCKYIVFDCEGYNLGEQGGNVSILTLLGLPSSLTSLEDAKVYLVDAMALETDTLQPIFDILRSSEVMKVMFDGRKDACELYHRYGVELSHVLDLQLADVQSRQTRGEGLDRQLYRLSSYCSRNDMRTQRGCYLDVHRINGLSFCLQEHGVASFAKPCEFCAPAACIYETSHRYNSR
jgi:exonuclease 3'-5' domain-containing protein 1